MSNRKSPPRRLVLAAIVAVSLSFTVGVTAEGRTSAGLLEHEAQQARSEAFNQIASWSANKDYKPSDLLVKAGEGFVKPIATELIKDKWGIPTSISKEVLGAMSAAASQSDAYQNAGPGGLILSAASNFLTNWAGAYVGKAAGTAVAPELGPGAILVGGAAGAAAKEVTHVVLDGGLDYNFGSASSPWTLRAWAADKINHAVSGTTFEDILQDMFGKSTVSDLYHQEDAYHKAAQAALEPKDNEDGQKADQTYAARALDEMNQQILSAMDQTVGAYNKPIQTLLDNGGSGPVSGDPFSFTDPGLNGIGTRPRDVYPNPVVANRPVKKAAAPQPPLPGDQHGLSDVTVSRRQIVLTLTDHEVVDGDIVTISLNGSPAIQSHELKGPPGSRFQLTLRPGANSIEVYAHNEGSLPPNTAQITISDVTSGRPEQNWKLGLGEKTTFRITTAGD